MCAPAAAACRKRWVFLSALQHQPRALLLPLLTGSDVTVQISSEDDRLTVQLPFGSHTRTFLQELSRCSPGTSSAMCSVLEVQGAWLVACVCRLVRKSSASLCC